MGGIMTPMINRNTTIPTSKKEIFSTAADNQPAVDVRVFQGERKMAEHNRLLGVFRLDGIPPAPRGVPKIEVTFDIDANGILNVSAKDTASGKEQKITIESSSGITKDDIERMKREAEVNAAEDEKRAELVETKNKADHLLHSTKQQLEEHKDKIPAELKDKIEAELKKVEEAVKTDDKAKIDAAIEQFAKVSQELGKTLYEQGGPVPGAGEPGPEAAAGAASGGEKQGEEDVIDADYEVKS